MEKTPRTGLGSFSFLSCKKSYNFLRYYHSSFSTFQKFELYFMKVNLLKASAV